MIRPKTSKVLDRLDFKATNTRATPARPEPRLVPRVAPLPARHGQLPSELTTSPHIQI